VYVGLLNNYLSENEPASWRRDYASPLDVVTSTIGNVGMVVDKYTLKPYKSTHFIGYTRPLALLLTFPFAGTIEVEALDWHMLTAFAFLRNQITNLDWRPIRL